MSKTLAADSHFPEARFTINEDCALLNSGNIALLNTGGILH
jgi:hypothetical protein